jgi:acetylglutamate kinase
VVGITVVKIGGNEIDDPAWLERLASASAAYAGKLLLVHGGGKEVTELQRVLGAEPEWREGLRVTTPEAIRAVSMVLSGLVNKRLVSLFTGAGLRALGLSGEDAGMILAEPKDGGRLGRTGEIREVRGDLLRDLLGLDVLPIVSPVSRGLDGGPMNVNADDAAAAVATALDAERLLFVSNIPGVLSGGETLREVSAEDVERLIADGTAAGGMAPKLRAAARAAGGGVGDVRIGNLDLLHRDGAGTRVGAASERSALAG